jgi:hypothetical protein
VPDPLLFLLKIKQQVFLMSSIFSALGIGVSVTIIAIGGGFSGLGPSITNPPSAADLWRVGEKIKEGEVINYSLTAIGPHSSLHDAKVSIDFTKDMGDDWKANFGVINATIHFAFKATTNSRWPSQREFQVIF